MTTTPTNQPAHSAHAASPARGGAGASACDLVPATTFHHETPMPQNGTPTTTDTSHLHISRRQSMAVRLLLHPGMDDVISNILMGETVVHKNPLATVTRNCLIVRDQIRGAQAIISFQSIRKIEKVNTTNISLLAIASGFLTIAAAAYSSHERYEVAAGIGLIGLLFVFGYFSTRRAAILFLLDDQSIKTARGSYREATSIIRAVERMTWDR
jgi:hypothetical protein